MAAKLTAGDQQFDLWERWWSSVKGRPGEIVWDPDESDLVAHLELFRAPFDPGLPVVDLRCGDGRQTRFLARHFHAVLGVDISPSAVERARAAANPPNVSYRALDACCALEGERLHQEIGDANVYVRGVLQALEPANRPDAIRTIAALLGARGTLFAKELPPQAGDYFAALVRRHGLWPELDRVMRLIPPGAISAPELASLFSPDRFAVIATGPRHIETVNRLPDGEAITVPAIYALVRPHERKPIAG